MILVTGATGYSGRFLLRRLVANGRSLRCLVRPTSDCADLERLGVDLHVGDLEKPAEVRPAFAGIKRIVHLAHIRYAPTVVACLESGVEQVVLISSLRRFSRVPSASVDEVQKGEEGAIRAGIPYTILRPSMIYGPGDDRNISRLSAYLRRRRWFPVFGSGRALQQPVYVEDVVDGILATLQNPCAIGKCYALAGAQALTYDHLIDAVGAAAGARVVKVHIPVRAALVGLWFLERFHVQIGIDGEQVRRLQEDKVFCIDAARADLGFSPLDFEEGLARIFCREGCEHNG